MEIEKTLISIGTTQGQMGTRNYFKKLMEITEEPDNTLIIDGMDLNRWYEYIGNGGL